MKIHKQHALAAALVSSFATSSMAATDTELNAVVVTATRFADADPKVPANITVLTERDLKDVPATNLPDILKTVAGIDSRPMYGPLGIDATVDMRGFGATATSNTLVLVDGLRTNPVDMGSIIWSSIPVEDIERIEIIRGSGTVLYGDGATGGVINIITRKGGKPRASIQATAGSRGYLGAGASFSASNDLGYFSLNAQTAAVNGYRDNSDQEQMTANGRAGLFLEHGETFIDYAVYKEAAELPGNRMSAAYHNDPRGATTPHDNQKRDGYRLRPGISYRLGSRLTLEAEAGIEHQDLNSRYIASSYFSDRARDTFSLTPRMRWQHGLGGLASETVAGIDFYDSDVTADNRGGPDQKAAQKSTAFYFQNITGLTNDLSLTLGARKQRVRQSASQDAYAAWFMGAMSGSETRSRSAYDIGLAYARDNWKIYGKTGTTFRFANADELFGWDNVLFQPVFAGDLRPQHGRIHEIGGQIRGDTTSLRASVYRLDLSDEIGFDGSANTNLFPTRRQGAEIEADWRVTAAFSLKATYAFSDATFRSGTFEGKEVPLVSRHQANLQATWNGGRAGTYSALVHRVGERRYGSDFANAQGMLDGYTTLDLQAGWNFRPWQITARLLNATDRKYSPFAGYSAFRNDTYYYPADGRALLVTGRYDF